MIAAFSLDYSGDPIPCDFRGCILDAWHDGDHQLAPKSIQWKYDRHCVVCGIAFMVIGTDKSIPARFDTCGREECLLHYARRFGFEAPVICRCPQRDYPHELSVHADLRCEWFPYRHNPRWPWSLMLSRREEPSTEKKVAE